MSRSRRVTATTRIHITRWELGVTSRISSSWPTNCGKLCRQLRASVISFSTTFTLSLWLCAACLSLFLCIILSLPARKYGMTNHRLGRPGSSSLHMRMRPFPLHTLELFTFLSLPHRPGSASVIADLLNLLLCAPSCFQRSFKAKMSSLNYKPAALSIFAQSTVIATDSTQAMPGYLLQ